MVMRGLIRGSRGRYRTSRRFVRSKRNGVLITFADVRCGGLARDTRS